MCRLTRQRGIGRYQDLEGMKGKVADYSSSIKIPSDGSSRQHDANMGSLYGKIAIHLGILDSCEEGRMVVCPFFFLDLFWDQICFGMK